MGCLFTRAIGCIGHDMDGAGILKDCKAHDIDTLRIQMTPEASTSFSDVMTTRETGIRASFNYPGANALLNVDDFHFGQNNCRLFFLGTLFFMSALDETIFRHVSKAALVLASTRGESILPCVEIERTNLRGSLVEAGGRAALAETDIVMINIQVAEILSKAKSDIPTAPKFSPRVLHSFGHAE